MRYEIKGGNLPVVICTLDGGESMFTESGAMSWMSPNMKMETTSRGGFGKALGRMFSGESLFLNRYTATGGPGMIAYASSKTELGVPNGVLRKGLLSGDAGEGKERSERLTAEVQ